ncbi:DUF6090 family protein [Maribellus mangrovi]|uniref:DUF6090 family protein n=1 Tax=Maribellus mangrovi TaxID=3133146 RepID=UPI0030EC4E91
MLTFFRRLRAALLAEGKTGKYLKYALGEILLVIIGILIALQINNSNEIRKTENKVVAILKEVQHDLGLDIQQSDELIAFYRKNDSIINLVQADKLTYEDYKGKYSGMLRNLILGAYHIQIHTNGYTNLMADIDKIPEGLKEIIDPLNEIYVYNKYKIDMYDVRLDKITDREADKLAATKDWYYQLSKQHLTAQMIDYFMTDASYKNATETYKKAARNLSNNVKTFRANAISAYLKINDLLESKEALPDFIPYNLVVLTQDQLQDYVGIYKLEKVENRDFTIPDMKIKIWIQDHQLAVTYVEPTGGNPGWITTNPSYWEQMSPLYFEDLDKAFGHVDVYEKIEFIRNNARQVTGLIHTPHSGPGAHFKKLKN